MESLIAQINLLTAQNEALTAQNNALIVQNETLNSQMSSLMGKTNFQILLEKIRVTLSRPENARKSCVMINVGSEEIKNIPDLLKKLEMYGNVSIHLVTGSLCKYMTQESLNKCEPGNYLITFGSLKTSNL